MNDWTEGYVADHMYEHYYFDRLSPSFLRQELLGHGMDLPPRRPDEPMRYLELGYGQGLSLNIHAAADQESEFWGTDFLPEQTLNARELSLLAGLGTHLLNDSFAELNERAKAGKLPSFDIIVMHGIWSWITHENQQHILDIIRTSLKPGGIVYISYNALPGRAGLMPIRELMALHAERKGAGKDSLTRATEAAGLVSALSAAHAAFFAETPACQAFAERIATLSPVYLAHEYLNRNWHAPYFFETAQNMALAGCRFLAPADPLQSFPVTQPEKTRALLGAVTDPVSRETLKDFNLNIGFRADIFIRDGGPGYLAAEEYKARLAHSFWAAKAFFEPMKALTIDLPYCKLELDAKMYEPVLETLAENRYEPKTLAFMQTCPRLAHMDYVTLLSCLRLLFASGHISPARPTPSEKTVAACRRLNRIFCEMTAKGHLQQHLVSPVLGMGVSVQESLQLFLLSYANGKRDAASWAADARAFMKARGPSLDMPSGQETTKGVNTLLQEATYFGETILPYLETMGILPECLSGT